MSAKVQTGLVGLFDILGYENMLERNEPEVILEKVLPALSDAASRTVDALKDLMVGSDHPNIPQKLHTLVFSDTLLLTLPMDDVAEPDKRHACWSIFLMACDNVQRKMFEGGLPLKGGIDYGKFYVDSTEARFAGRSIVNAYKAAKELNLAACVLTEDAKKSIGDCEDRASYPNGALVGHIVRKYLTPLKGGEEERLLLAAETFDGTGADIRTQVIRAFQGHNKNIQQSCHQMMLNTEFWLSYLREVQEHRKAKGPKK